MIRESNLVLVWVKCSSSQIPQTSDDGITRESGSDDLLSGTLVRRWVRDTDSILRLLYKGKGARKQTPSSWQ